MQPVIPASSLSALHYGALPAEVASSIFVRQLGLPTVKNAAMNHGSRREAETVIVLGSLGVKGVAPGSKTRQFEDVQLSATPDLFVEEDGLFGYLVEIKNPFSTVVTEEVQDVFEPQPGCKSLRDYYKIYELQCQIQMFCHQVYDLMFVVHSGEDVLSLKVQYDEQVLYKALPTFQEISKHLQELQDSVSKEEKKDELCILVDEIIKLDELHTQNKKVLEGRVAALRYELGESFKGEIRGSRGSLKLLKTKHTVTHFGEDKDA